MRRSLFTLAAAGLAASMASAAFAGHKTSHDTSYLKQTTLTTEDGTCVYSMAAKPDGWSTLSASDQAALTDLYARHVLAADIMGAHLDAYREKDPQTAELFGNMMTEHLILASRARQLYRQTGTMPPYLQTDINEERLASTNWADWATNNHAVQVTYFKESYPAVSDNRLQMLVLDTRECLDGQNLMVRDQIAYNASLTGTATERVAGVRQEQQGDAQVLMLFIGSQLEEASRLRVEAPRLRTEGKATIADHFISMAGEHEMLASRGGELLKSMGGEMPPAPAAHPQVSDGAMPILKWEEHAHKKAVKMLSHFIQDAQSQEVKALLMEAKNGAEKHLEMLQQHLKE